MDITSLFTAALQLSDPWRVPSMEFRDEADGRRELHIAIGFATNSRFHYPETGLGIDGTGIKGRNCITVVADLAERNVVCVVPGKDAHTVERFARDFTNRNGDPNRMRLVTCGMSMGFAKSIREHLPNAARVIDKFHVVKRANPNRTSIGDQAQPAETSAQDR